MLKKLNMIFRFLLLAAFVLSLLNHFLLEDFDREVARDEKLYSLLSLQRQIDRYAPMSETHLQGTHNSYNSDTYHTLLRYHDRQQRLTVGEQLENGARFIELDAHWTFNAPKMTHDILLCHGSSKFQFLPFHWGCSPFDITLDSVLAEISEWIYREDNKQEVIIFYIEDHLNEEYEYFDKLLKKHDLRKLIYESGGCQKIPDWLTKAHVLAAGKQIIFWKDKSRFLGKNQKCASDERVANLAFNELGAIGRHAEDRTFFGSLAKRIENGEYLRINAEDVHAHLLDDANILNFDNFVINDERLYSFLWSWDIKNDLNTVAEGSCVYMNEAGRWVFQECSDEAVYLACYSSFNSAWKLTKANAGNVQREEDSCMKFESYRFSSPVNLSENHKLHRLMKESDVKSVKLNIRYYTNHLEVGDKRAFFK
jgi:hypothetical protein